MRGGGRRVQGVLFWIAVAACLLLALFCLLSLPYGNPLFFSLLFVTLLLILMGLATHRPGTEWRCGWAHSLLSVGTAGLAGLDSWLLVSWWAS